jgi:hypothetical protein
MHFLFVSSLDGNSVQIVCCMHASLARLGTLSRTYHLSLSLALLNTHVYSLCVAISFPLDAHENAHAHDRQHKTCLVSRTQWTYK